MVKQKRIPSMAEQRRALKKKHIPTKGLSKWTLYRRYHYYIKKNNPASDPVALAYGEKRRFEQRLDKDGQRRIETGTGRTITAQEYIRHVDKTTSKKATREMPATITAVKTSQRFKSGKREDRFRYVFNPEAKKPGLVVNALNVKNILERLQQVHIPELMEAVDLLYKHRGHYLYRDRTIGALILYETAQMPHDAVPRPVKFSTREKFPGYLHDMLYELLVIDILRHYKDAIIRLRFIDVFIRTRQSPTNIERML